MSPPTLFTIGFTKKSAEYFFRKLSEAGVKKLIDTRLSNVSQLAGFAKREDLRFFLKAICDIEYVHVLEFAPTQGMLEEYKKVTRDWKKYEKKFVQLITRRRIENLYSAAELDGACLLCSEERPHHCHRRLVAEYLKSKHRRLEITHLI
jgi:uncharacterized protein (DUF488 family)